MVNKGKQNTNYTCNGIGSKLGASGHWASPLLLAMPPTFLWINGKFKTIIKWKQVMKGLKVKFLRNFTH